MILIIMIIIVLNVLCTNLKIIEVVSSHTEVGYHNIYKYIEKLVTDINNNSTLY